MNMPAWPWTTTSRRNWLGRPSSYRASTQQPLISSFHNGYDSKSATIAMIAAAEAATSTVLLTNGIGRAYRLEQRPNRPRDRTRSPAHAVDIHVHPVPDSRQRLVRLEERQPIRDAAVAEPRDREPDHEWIGELQFGKVLTARLRDHPEPRHRQRVDPARCVDPTVDRGVEELVIHRVVEVAEHVVVRPPGQHRPVHWEIATGHGCSLSGRAG